MRPLIGVLPIYDETGFGGYKTMTACLDFVEACGGAPVLLPDTTDAQLISELAQRCDGVLIAGGHDINPALYGRDDVKVNVRRKGPAATSGMFADNYAAREAAAAGMELDPSEADTLPEVYDENAVYVTPERDELDRQIIHFMLELDKPILGVCRGMQAINVHFGGTLYTDLDAERPQTDRHVFSRERKDERHAVDLVAGSPLREVMGVGRIAVNSYHHQGVRELARNLEVMAHAEDGLIEALRLPTARFCWGVQWHPESIFEAEESSLLLGRHFVGECRRG